LIDALKKQGVLDAHAPLVFGRDLKAYLENGFEILTLYRTIVIASFIVRVESQSKQPWPVQMSP
jgi:hypothetical protein